MEDLSFLQKRVAQRAVNAFEKDMKDLCDYLQKHPIGRKLKIKIGEGKDAYLSNDHNQSILKRTKDLTDVAVAITNLENIKKELINEYYEKETDALLNDVQHIRTFIDRSDRIEIDMNDDDLPY